MLSKRLTHGLMLTRSLHVPPHCSEARNCEAMRVSDWSRSPLAAAARGTWRKPARASGGHRGDRGRGAARPAWTCLFNDNSASFISSNLSD